MEFNKRPRSKPFKFGQLLHLDIRELQLHVYGERQIQVENFPQ